MDLDLDLDLDTFVPLVVEHDTPTEHQRARDIFHPQTDALPFPRSPVLLPPEAAPCPPQKGCENGSYASSIQSVTDTLYLRVRPDPQNPLKRVITTFLSANEEEVPNLAAQRLWDMEQQTQREMGPEKFRTHTFMMPPLNDPKTATLLIVEFVDSGWRFKYENCSGVSQWNFQPMLGGVSYWRGADRGMGNLYGFKPRMHDFFTEPLVPVTLRIYRYLMALLELRDPLMVCDEAEEMHEHYPIKIALNKDVLEKPEFTKHLVCGNMLVAVLFEALTNAYEDQKGLELCRLGPDSAVLTGETVTYTEACENGWRVDNMGFPKGFTVHLLALNHEKGRGSPMDIGSLSPVGSDMSVE